MPIYKGIIEYHDGTIVQSKPYSNIDDVLSYLDSQKINNLVDKIYITKNNVIIHEYSYKSFNRKYYLIDKDIIDDFTNEYMDYDDPDIFDNSYISTDNKFVLSFAHELQPESSIKKVILKRMEGYDNILTSV